MSNDKQYTREELEDKLTPKERIFCHEYIVDWNKARAARAAGYSEDTARQIGYEIFTKPYIKQYIEFIKNDLEKEAGISKLMIVNEWKKIAFSNITNILDITKLNLPEELKEALKNGGGDTVTLKEGLEKLSELPSEITDTVSELAQTRDGIKLKMYCKDNALKQLADLMGYNAAQKLDHTSKGESISLTPMQFVTRDKDK